jgi:Tfp pilus assembly protein PilW
MTMLRTRPTRGARDRGTTLVELNVTMIVLAVIVAATMSLIIGFQRSNAENMSRQEQIDSARFSVEAMSKSIRTAVKPAQISALCSVTCTEDAFLMGADFAVQFYANLNNEGGLVGPSRVSYSVATSGPTAGQLIETIQTPDSATPGPTGFAYCDAASPSASADCKARFGSRLLADGVLTDGNPLFRFYTRDGLLLDPAASGGTLAGSDMATVVAVELVVNVQAPNGTRAEPTQYVQRVMLPNVQAVIRQLEEEETP